MARELAVVGAGVSGLAAAAALSQAGCAVTVLERASFVGGVLGPHDPAVAELLYACSAAGVRVRLETTALRWHEGRLLACGDEPFELTPDWLLLAGGSRPSTVAELELQGTRPAGVLAAPAALALLRERVPIGRSPIVLGAGHWARASLAALAQAGTPARALALAGEAADEAGTGSGAGADVAGAGARTGARVVPLALSGRTRVQALLVRDGGADVSMPCDAVVLAARARPARTVAGAVLDDARRVSHLDDWPETAGVEQVIAAARGAALALLRR